MGGTFKLLGPQFGQGVIAVQQLWVNAACFSSGSADVVDGHTPAGVVNDGPRRAKGLIVGVGKGDQEALWSLCFFEYRCLNLRLVHKSNVKREA